MRGTLWSAHCWVQEVSVRWRGLRACNTACATPAETGGSATELSVTDAWRGAAVGDEAYVRLIKTVARSSFRQNARYLTEPRESVSKAIEDITDRRAAERGLAALLHQSETLLQEMQYHVASSLQIVAGILFLKVRTAQSEETPLHFQHSHQRIMR
jgi:hypothetical protein